MKILEGPLLSVNCISDCTYKHSSECVSHSVMSDSLLGSSVHGILQTRIPIQKSCHSLLQGIFPTPGLNPSILHRGQILYPLSQKAQYKSIALYSFLRGSALKSPVETAWEIPRDKEELRREVGKNLVPLEQGLANDSCWCKYFHCNTDSSFVCIISVAVLTYTGKGGLPQKTRGPQGLKLLLSGPLKKCLPTPVEKAMAPHSSTLAWKIPWMEEPGRLQSMGSLRVRHD